MPRRHIVLQLAPALALAACTHQPWVAPSARWTTLETEHFRIHTDVARRDYQRVVERFELTHAALEATYFRGVQIPRVEAMVFADPEECRELFGPRTAGIFIPGRGLGGSLLAVRHQGDAEWIGQVVAHELTHRFVAVRFPGLPRWLHEGLAEYFETLRVQHDGHLHLGAVPTGPTVHYELRGSVPLQTLLNATAADVDGPNTAAYYASAWAFVHYLLNGEKGRYHPRFEDFLVTTDQARSRGQGPGQALATVYPEIVPPDLDQAMEVNAIRQVHLGYDQLLVLPFAPPPPPTLQTAAADRALIRDHTRWLLEHHKADVARAEEYEARRAPPRLAANFARIDLEPAELEQYGSLTYGRMATSRLAVEAELSRSRFGYGLTPRARVYRRLGEGEHLFVTMAAGAVFALKSEALGQDVEHAPTIGVVPSGYFFGFNPEVGFELRTPVGLLIRGSLSMLVPLAGTLAEMCEGARPTDGSSCYTDSGTPSGAVMAADDWHVFGRLGAGWSW